MITEYNKATLKDLKGKCDVEIEVNFNPELTDYVRISMGNKESVVAVKDLFTLVFSVANAEQQEMLTPVRRTTITKYIKQHTVTAKKTIRPGEKLVVNCEIDIPTTIEDGFKGLLKKKSNILV